MSGRPYKIVQVNILDDLNGIIVIEIFEVKVLYDIFLRGYYQGITILNFRKCDHLSVFIATFSTQIKFSNIFNDRHFQ